MSLPEVSSPSVAAAGEKICFRPDRRHCPGFGANSLSRRAFPETAALLSYTTVFCSTAWLRAAACDAGLEGIVSKRLTAPYKSGPCKSWVKTRNPKSAAYLRSRGGADGLDRAPHKTLENFTATLLQAADQITMCDPA